MASLLSFLLILFLIFFSGVGGKAACPPTVLGMKAPLRLSLILGILAIPWPVCQLWSGAVVLFPAIGSLPWGWNL